MSLKIFFLVFFVVLFSFNRVYSASGGCIPGDVINRDDPNENHNEFSLSTTPFTCEQIKNGKTYHYKEGNTSVKLATTCVPEKFCGGNITGWIKGRHPKNNNNKENAKICVHKDGDCCAKEFDVQIKKCENNFYYKYEKNINCNRKIQMCTSRQQAYDTTPCDNNPCKNGGTCIIRPRYEYICQCHSSYTGLNCETGISTETSTTSESTESASEETTVTEATTEATTGADSTTESTARADSTSEATTGTESASEETTATEETTESTNVETKSASSSLNSNSSTTNNGNSASAFLSTGDTFQPTLVASPINVTSLSASTSNSKISSLNTNTVTTTAALNTLSTGLQLLSSPSAGDPSINIPSTSLSGALLIPAPTARTLPSGTVSRSPSSNSLSSLSAAATTERVDGGFSEWSIWASCTTSCGTGNTTRRRTCTNPSPTNNGSTCNGSYTDIQECNTQPCPIDGGWSAWTPWSYCNKPCGTGSTRKTRTCTNPSPMYGGQPCAGAHLMENPCNSLPCADVVLQYAVRFTSEVFHLNLQNQTTPEWSDMEAKIITNVSNQILRSIYTVQLWVTTVSYNLLTLSLQHGYDCRTIVARVQDVVVLAEKRYTIDSNVVHTAVISHSPGSVISTFNVSYSPGIDSIQVVQILESIHWNGVFGVLPAQIISITPDVVPIEPPTITYVSNSSSTSILLKWTQVPDVNVVGYAVYYKEEGTKFLPENVKTTPAVDQEMEVGGLKKYTKYSLVLLAFSSKGNGVPSTFVNASTDEDVPSKPPGNFKVVTRSSTSLFITWEAIQPGFHHGIFLGYNITFMKHGWGNDRTPLYKIIKPGTHTLTLEGLGKYTTYTITACGFTSKGCGMSNIVTAQTAEDVPSMPPQNFHALNLTSESSINLSWDPVPRDHVNGILVGYVIRYKQTSSTDVKVPVSDLHTRYVAPGSRNIVFDGIPQYSEWKFQISAITNIGEGVSSNFTYGASCRCPQILYTNYFVHPPYLTAKDDGSFDGVFYNITEQMIKWACGNCRNGHGETDVNMKSNGKGKDACKQGPVDLINDIDDVPHISFPVYGNRYMDKYMGMYEYIHLVDSPGVAFITIDKPVDAAGKRIVASVFGCMPLLLLAVLMALLAGFVVWVLEFWSSPEQFSPSFFSGFWDGFWWAYISMTTVGYGDRFTVSDVGKVFSIIWTLTGLVIISMFTGSIATELTSENVQQDIILYGAKVAAIHNSTEHRLGILKNAKVNTDKEYKNFEELKHALKARQVQGILLDLYVAAENQDSIFDSEIKVKKLLEKKFGYGIVLSGASAVVRERCRDYIKKNIADITKLIETKMKTIEPHKDETADNDDEVTMFDSESTIFQEFLMFCCAFLACAGVGGVIYQFGCYVPKHRAIATSTKGTGERGKDNPALYKDELLQELNKMVEEFHQTQTKKLEMMKERHRLELLQVIVDRRAYTKHFLRLGKGRCFVV